jgi:hypothetical protein
MPQSVATPNMNLATWPTTSHFFNHTELGANFTTIDQHDHTTGKGLPIPAGGLAVGAVTNSVLAGNAVTTTRIADANVTDAKLASPNNLVYRSLFRVMGSMTQAQVAGTYSPGGPTGGVYLSGTNSSGYLVSFFHITPADYVVAGKTAFYRLKATVGTNTVAPARTVTFGLYPVTFAGTGGNLAVTLGSVVSSSTAAIASPPASSATTLASSDFTIGSTGPYAFGVVLAGGSIAANSAISFSVQLDMHNL